MAESFYPESLMRDPGIMDLHLYHPNLVPVVDFFNYTPFGRTRYYAVAEPRQGVRLSQLSMPRPGMQVFGWALQLADVLDYLHSRGVVGVGAEADDILVQGDMASLASLQNARAMLEESEERTQQQSTDLARLAGTIYEAYTGLQASMSPEGMLPMPSQAPEKVAVAFRAAIEPVHGIAPPISAAQWRDLLSSALIAIAEMEQPGRPIEFIAGSMTDVGRLRDQNQDSYCITEFAQSSVERPMRIGLYVIGDGMGGHKGGEIASAIAVQVFASEVMARILAPLSAATGTRPALSNEAILQGMARAVQSANERIYKARDSRQNDMGTTLVAALIAAGKAYIINVGDSRLYFYTRKEKEGAGIPMRADATAPLQGTAPLPGTTPLQTRDIGDTDELPTRVDQDLDEPQADEQFDEGEEQAALQSEYMLTQVSVDHSLVHRLVELGQLDPEEAKVHPHRNFIYRSLGGPPPIEVDTFVRTLHPGDRLLLCSDGLNSMIEDEDIESVLASEPDPDVACGRLIDLANEAGGHDNITTIVIDVTDYLPFPEHPQAFGNA
jgi:protein phosphatase